MALLAGLNKSVTAAEGGGATFAGMVAFAIMAIMFVDVGLRYALNSPLPWSYDLIGMYLVPARSRRRDAGRGRWSGGVRRVCARSLARAFEFGVSSEGGRTYSRIYSPLRLCAPSPKLFSGSLAHGLA